MAEIAIPAAATLAAPALQHLLKKINAGKDSTISLADMHELLGFGLDELLAVQRDKENEVSRNIIQKDKSEVYKVWEKRVSNIKEEKDSLDKEYVKLKDKKFSLRKRPRLQKKIRKALQKVVRLLEQCPEKSMVDKPTERVIKEVGVPSIAEYTTLNSALQEIQKLLQKDEVKCVALHGQKGVGKTTIMKHLNNHFYDDKDDKKFDMVIFIKVPDYKQTDEFDEELHILQKIGERIKVDGEGEFDEVARRMQSTLEKIRYLLILDGVRHARTLDRIWENLDISKDKRDSKVVITTDYPLVMKLKCVQRKVELKKLSDNEAWEMFQGIVGNSLPKKAQLICKRFCSCLPLLINHIAKSFKYQEVPVDWQGALDECEPWPQFGVEGLREVYSYLQSLCLKRLRNQGVDKCFLYASLYPANSKICTKYFVECWIAQGFLDDVYANTKYIEMRRKAIDRILTYLVNVAFLEEDEQMRYVKMDDLYRDFALYISSKDSDSDSKCRTYVDKEEHDERRPVRPESWQDVRWVSMIGTKRDSLTTTQDCQSLQTLLLQKNTNLVNIPSNYFESMGDLRVLNLYGGVKINKLPSLKGLTKLKALYLNGCSDLGIESHEIESLKHLEIFDSRGTLVDFVPCLESLWCLRIPYIASCDQRDNYDPISKLHKLEELTIEVESTVQWGTNAECIMGKVASLENLTTFRCRFPSSGDLKKFLDASKSWREKQSVHFQESLSLDYIESSSM